MFLRHLDTLLAIVDEGSFDAAASTLGVSASAVSQRIKALEADVGRVLVRRTSPTTITPAGEVLVQTARRMRLLESEAASQLDDTVAKMPLSIVINADSLGTWFADVFRSVRTALHIRVEDEKHSLRMLQRGDCMGVVTTEKKPVAGCQSEFLGLHRYLPIASPQLAAQLEEGTYTWETLPHARFGKKDVLETVYLQAQLGQFQAATTRRETHVPSFEAINAAIAAGSGWGMVPEQAAVPLLDSGQCVTIDPRTDKGTPNWLDVPLYWQRWKVESALLDELSDAIHSAAAAHLR